ncbi:uncharacterized protein [Antedon mediterranea]|uniref:uncharacterized protein n=1 Tax=Antedon mediterranea TaxID=105859 RepID=UPI003AF874E5
MVLKIKVKYGRDNKDKGSPTPKTNSRGAVHSKLYRERLKKDPEEWKRFQERENARHRQRRARRSEADKLRDREKSRTRQQRFVERKKAEGEKIQQKVKPLATRSEKMKKAEYNKIKKRESRARMTSQHKRRVKEKDAKRKREKRNAKRKKQNINQTPSLHKTSGFPSITAKRMAASRLWAKLPKEPERFAEIVEEFVKGSRTTPRKKAALRRHGLGINKGKRDLQFQDLITENLKNKLQVLKKKSDTSSRKDRRLLASAHLISKKYHMQSRLANNWINKSRGVSWKCLSIRHIKCGKAKIHIIINIISHSLFQKLRPNTVLLQHKTKLNQCLCEYCTSILLKLQALNRAAVAYKMPTIKIKNKYELIALTMCPKEDNEKYNKPGCIYRECEDCGVSLLKTKVMALEEHHGEEMIQWMKWSDQQYELCGKTKMKKVVITERTTVSNFLQEFVKETESLSKHLFVANWQQDGFTTISKTLPENWTLMVLDFAENYSCLRQLILPNISIHTNMYGNVDM